MGGSSHVSFGCARALSVLPVPVAPLDSRVLLLPPAAAQGAPGWRSCLTGGGRNPVCAEVDGIEFRWLAMPGPPACALVVDMVAKCDMLMRYDIRRVPCLAFSYDAPRV